MDRQSMPAACNGDSDGAKRRHRDGENFFGGPSLRLQRRASVFKARRQCNAWLESDWSNDESDLERTFRRQLSTAAAAGQAALVEARKQPDASHDEGPDAEESRARGELPICFMEVYQRLKLGRLGQTFGSEAERPVAWPAAIGEAGEDSSASANSDLLQLQRLLRDRDRAGAAPTAPPQSQAPPVPKPRRLARAPPAASSRTRRRHSAAQESTCGSSCGPFASAAVSTAEPFESPRYCRADGPTELTEASQAVAFSGGPQQSVVYYIADWQQLRRLSITGRLQARDRGRAPTRWLSSAALYTHLRYPLCREIASLPRCSMSPSPEVADNLAPAVASHATVKHAKHGPAQSREGPNIFFAFKAMEKRRQRSMSRDTNRRRRRRSAKTMQRNIYAVPVS